MINKFDGAGVLSTRKKGVRKMTKATKKIMCAVIAALTVAAAGCSADTDDKINVYSREDGSGTRGAFVEMFELEDENGEDMTTVEAGITNNTAVMMTTVAGDTAAIGYISLGSLNDTVKAVKIDGVEATAENVANGTYKIARPFNIAVNGEAGAEAAEFIGFILSAEGKKIIEESGYIAVAEEGTFSGTVSGELRIEGSSSVTPVMEKLKEAYMLINPSLDIKIQETDSSAGVSAAVKGTCDIAMVSRELKDSEKAEGLVPTVIAMDGIAVIVNNENPCDTLTSEDVHSIFAGEITSWSDIG